MSQPKPSNDIIRHGFGLKAEILSDLNADYHSSIIEEIRANNHEWSVGGLRFRLARAFGFCYGVDKAIDFAYETRRRFPDRRIFLTNEIIHNPRVNRRLTEMGIRIISGSFGSGMHIDEIRAEDVVIIPAFGVDTSLLTRLRAIGCIMVDTTCGSVVHVWKRVERYAKAGFTSIIHGKWAHEETVATCSYATRIEGGQHLVVRDLAEAAEICEFIRTGEDAERLTKKYRTAMSPNFRFERHLKHVGIANQTTMLASESLAVADLFRGAMLAKYGETHLDEHFRSFETICGATQERQDAVIELMKQPPTLMLVIGGFNSSNTAHLCEIAAEWCPTYHVDDAECLVSPNEIRHLPPTAATPILSRGWLPSGRPLEIGLTAGASTPNKVIGEVIERLAHWELGDQAAAM